MLKQLITSIVILPLVVFCADYWLVENGNPKAELVIGAKPTRTAQFAALEMQHCIKLMSGATLPIVASPSGTAGSTEIHIGLDGDKYDFTGEEYLISFKDGKIILVGNDNLDYEKVDYSKEETFPPMEYYYRATLFAVYDFLEKACGIRFYSFGDNGIAFKPSKTISVTPFELRRKPEMDAFRAPHFEGEGLKQVTKRDHTLLLHRWRNVYCYGYVNHNIYGSHRQASNSKTFSLSLIQSGSRSERRTACPRASPRMHTKVNMCRRSSAIPPKAPSNTSLKRPTKSITERRCAGRDSATSRGSQRPISTIPYSQTTTKPSANALAARSSWRTTDSRTISIGSTGLWRNRGKSILI